MLCWSQEKGHIKQHIKKFTSLDMKDMSCEGFKKVGPEQWRMNISHGRDKRPLIYKNT